MSEAPTTVAILKVIDRAKPEHRRVDSEDPYLNQMREYANFRAGGKTILLGRETDYKTLIPVLMRLCDDRVQAFKFEPTTVGRDNVVVGIENTMDITELAKGFLISNDEDNKLSLYIDGAKVPDEMPEGAYIAISPGSKRKDAQIVTDFADAFAGEDYQNRRKVLPDKTVKLLHRVMHDITETPIWARLHPVTLPGKDFKFSNKLFTKIPVLGNMKIYLEGFTKQMRAAG